jgi:hypothetical protein
VLPYVPAELLRYLSRLLAVERRRRATPARSRKLTCRDQAILRLVFEPIGNPVSVGSVGAGHAVKALNNLAAVDALPPAADQTELARWCCACAHPATTTPETKRRSCGWPGFRPGSATTWHHDR